VLVVPLLVALFVLRDPHWLALHDLVQIEMRVRDVSGGHPPLLGLGGRIDGHGQTGSHPGPVSFYALWPVYQLLGADGWALQAAAVTLVAVASGLAVWIAHRRGGLPFALAATGVLALLLRGYGAELLSSAWNPHAPVVWWIVFVLAVWSVLGDDVRLLPVAAFAGVYCAQTHLPYVVPVAGLGALTAAVLATRVWRGRRAEPVDGDDDPAGGPGPAAVARRGDDAAGRRRVLVWGGIAAGILVVLLAPPAIEQSTNSPGNVTIIVESFRHPTQERVSKGEALDVWLEHLDLAALARRDTNDVTSTLDKRLRLGARLPGLLLLAVWAGAAAVAWRRRDGALLRLHLVLAVAEALTLLAVSRILGLVWPYLVFSAWGTTALVVLAVGWTFLSRPAAAPTTGPADVQSQTAGPDDEPGTAPAPAAGPSAAPAGATVAPLRAPRPMLAGLAAATAVVSVAFTVDSAHTEMFDAELATAIDTLSGATAQRLAEDPAGCGDDCSYLVTFADPVHLVSPVFGLLLELEKRGYDVGADAEREVAVRSHRVIDLEDADAVIELAVGDMAIAGWRDRPGAEEIDRADPPGGEAPLAVFLVEPDAFER